MIMPIVDDTVWQYDRLKIMMLPAVSSKVFSQLILSNRRRESLILHEVCYNSN